MKRKGGLSMDGLDRIGECLGLELRPVKQTQPRKG